METILLEIISQLKATGDLDEKALAKIIHRHNKGRGLDERPYAKKRLLPYYLKIKESDPTRWEGWGIDPEIEKLLFQLLQVKPRRTASGVATITVITKPWKCSSNCLYCPNDLRMPKSYLSDEPACQRAERNYFDPYLQVTSRLRALTHMGHATDKIELIVLGGTWSDYPESYQIWYVTELFRALNDTSSVREADSAKRRRLYRSQGLSNREEDLLAATQQKQNEVNEARLNYNHAMKELYEDSDAWKSVSAWQIADLDALTQQHMVNENAVHRVVGLVIETRPDTISSENLSLLRRLGCTKVQVGIQSLDHAILKQNKRAISPATIQQAFESLRIFGFKIHAHFMVNLYGSSPEKDKQDYLDFVTAKPYIPDEVKLYPCSLVQGTGLCAHFADGSWRPYTEEELLDVLITDTLNTPPYIRISRMIRDISAHDIVAGNKKTNLRQLVERRIEISGKQIEEIRHREISTSETAIEELRLEVLDYETTATHEHFLQWITPENKIAGFLRLSLPKADYLREHRLSVPVNPGEAMIREVHVYGKVAHINTMHAQVDGAAQHLGLGKQLIETACDIARAEGFEKLNVISSIGTREYYRKLGFADNGLYQQMDLS